MTFMRRHLRLIGVAASCAALGAGASAIASAGAATSGTAQGSAGKAAHGRGLGRFAGRRLLARSVHGDITVATKTGFATITFDRGFVQSVSGQQLTLREGTKLRTYKSVTLTIPAEARVRDNGGPATLASLMPGQRVLVWAGPKRTSVIAHNVK